MNTFTISLSDAQLKALAYVACDPQDWIENAIYERCRIAMEEIFTVEVTRMIADPSITEIPADRDVVVLAADIKSAAQRHQEMIETTQG